MKTLLFISLFISVTSCKYIVKGAKTILVGKKVYDNTVTKNKKTQINFPNNYKYKKSDIILLNKKMRKRLQDVDQKITLNELYFSAAVERKFIKYLNISKKNSFLNIKRIDLISTKLDKDKNNPFTKEEMEYLKIRKLLKLKQLKDKK
jgi:hypothetical protein